MAQSLEEKDAALGNWLRRLLHVPSLTTYEWQPGKLYGGVAAPPYRAISYTWGRWRLSESEKCDVQAMLIDGVSWPIPRVDLSKFTPEQLRNLLERARSSIPRYMTKRNYRAVDFVWLDIAGIGHPFDDRSCNTELFQQRSAAEIGRQAKIFEDAQAVFVWFKTLTCQNLQASADRMKLRCI